MTKQIVISRDFSEPHLCAMERRESEEYEEDDTDPLDEELKKEIRKVHDDDENEGEDEEETPGKPSGPSATGKSFLDDPIDFFVPAYVRQRISTIMGYSMQGVRTLGNVLWFSSTTAMVLLIPIYYAFSLATAAQKFQYEPNKQVQDYFMHPGSTIGPPNTLDTYGVAAADAAESSAPAYTNMVRPNPNLPNSS